MSKAETPTSAAPTLRPDLPRYLTIQATAERLGYSAQTVAMMIQEGRLPAVNIASGGSKTRALHRIRADAIPAPRIGGPGRVCI